MKNYNRFSAKALKAIAAVVCIIRALLTSGADITAYISRKNKKLQPNELTDFIIWNLPAVFTCPGRTGHCTKDCYALAAENYRPNVRACRVRNYLFSRLPIFTDYMTDKILKIAARSSKKYIIVRVHESGDFYNLAYVEKWLEIMQRCSVDPRIHFIAYTKSSRFFDGRQLPKNFSLRASVWDDTPEADLEIIRRNDWPIYTAVDKFRKGDHFTPCPCKDCARCRKCWQAYKDIRCPIH